MKIKKHSQSECFINVFYGGADRDRTDDLLTASQALSQLSYSPVKENGI